MKTKKVSIFDIKKIHTHPASILFRTIELNAIYFLTKNYTFKIPSVDIGCADGSISNLLFDNSITYGIDNGEVDDYKLAIKNNVFKKVFIQSATNTDLKDSSVNFAFSNSVLEHIKDIDSVLSETNRFLKKDGYFLFSVPSIYFTNFLNLKDPITKYYAKKLNKKLNHYHLYDHAKWIEKLNKHGFKVIDYSYYISKNTLIFWNILLFLGLFVNHKLINLIFEKAISKNIESSEYNKNKGACLVFLCKKIIL